MGSDDRFSATNGREPHTPRVMVIDATFWSYPSDRPIGFGIAGARSRRP